MPVLMMQWVKIHTIGLMHFYEDNGAGYHFSMGIDSFMPAARNSGIYGFTIRCVAK